MTEQQYYVKQTQWCRSGELVETEKKMCENGVPTREFSEDLFFLITL